MFHTVSLAQGSMVVDIGSQSKVQYMLWVYSGYATQGMRDAITLTTYAIIKICRAFHTYFEQVLKLIFNIMCTLIKYCISSLLFWFSKS